MKEFIKNIKFVWQYSKSEKNKIILYFLLSIFSIVASIIYPIISANMIVNLTSNQLNQLVLMALVLLTTGLITETLGFFKSKLYEKIFRKIYINIQSNLGSEILKLNNKTLEDNG